MSAQVWNKFWGRSSVMTPHCNGVGGYIPQVQRMTLKFCKSSTSSRGVRDYIEQHLIHYARTNPHVVMYLKPRRHKTPVLKAEYVNGNTEYFNLRDKSVDEVQRWIHEFSTRSGNPTAMIDNKFIFTEHLSVQGSWTPFTHRHPATLAEQYPHAEGLQAIQKELTATEQLRLMQEEGLEERPRVKVARDSLANLEYGRPEEQQRRRC